MLSKDPQTLEEPITQAHVCAKFLEVNEDKTSHKNDHPYNVTLNKSNNNKTHKNNNDTTMYGKKTKLTSRPLLKEDFECAKKENLCFFYMGNHNKRDFPTLKKAKPQKDKPVHTMQNFPLELSS